MCIILYKPAGIDLPDKSILKNCWTNNSDGAGMMYRTKQGIVGKKGYMKQKSILTELNKYDWRKTELVIHFRFATHGLRDGTATHPFPLSNDVKDLTKTHWKSEAGIVHNGIISGFGTEDLSDTQEFIKKELSFFNPIADRKEVHNFIGSHGGKFVLMTIKNTYIIGDFIEHDGCYYSNGDYKDSYFKGYSKSWYRTFEKDNDYEHFIYSPLNTDFCRLTGKMADLGYCVNCDNFDYKAELCLIAAIKN